MQLRADSYLSAFSFLSTYVEYESWRCTAISELMINEQIRDKEVRLIGENGEQLGIMSAKDAYKMARDAELDLVKIAPAAKPPVCKIIDYGKYRYELSRKEKEAKKKQKVTQVKEIRVSTFIEKHDLEVKANNAAKFLKDGDKVKVSLRFKGREKGYANIGEEVMKTFADAIAEVGVIEKKPMLEGRSMIMTLGPKNN